MEEPDSHLDNGESLSEQHLKELSKSVKSVIPGADGNEPNEDDIKSLSTLFEEVFNTAFQPTLNATHRVAAWNFLCGLIDQCSISQSEQVRDLIWIQHLWKRAFDLYLYQSHNARPKSAKQLLATLSSTLRKSARSEDFTLRVSKRLVTGIRAKDDHEYTKSCLQVLAFFLGRDVLSLDVVLDSLSDDSSNTSVRCIHQSFEQLLAILFNCVGKGDYGSTIGQAISITLDKGDQIQPNAEASDTPPWLKSLESAMHNNNVQLDELRTQIMPILFKRSLSDYVFFLKRQGLQQLVEGVDFGTWNSREEHARESLLLDALLTGKDLRMLYETENSALSLTETSILLPLQCIERLLHNSSRTARLAGLSLLVISRSATKPFPSRTFKILNRHLSVLFADTDANFRGEVSSLLQRLMDRCRAATAVLARQSSNDSASLAAMLEYEDFLLWLLRFLAWELRPTASYQRHISALKVLLVIAKSGVDNAVPIKFRSKSALNETKWPFFISIMHQGLRRQLLDLLMDPFDEVRQTSAAVLSLYSASYRVIEGRRILEGLTAVVDRAEGTMLATGRADHADGVAHLYSLLIHITDDTEIISGPIRTPRQSMVAHLVGSLEQMLDTAKWSLAVAAKKYPIHGLLTSIRYTMTQDERSYHFENILSRLVNCLHRVWETVNPVLCNDAPEGYVPEDSEDVQDVTTKDTLSYCWRALKESSLLLGVLANSQLLGQDMLLDLGNLCFTQLAELRHRGAFSTVAQTWITCCIRCQDLKLNGQHASQWRYDRVLSTLRSKTTINTRRSAGLPSLICGLLIADKTGQSTSKAILDLTAIARQPVNAGDAQESSLPQVHALNCIKDVLKNTRLAEHSERFVAHAFLLAAESLRSEAWAIRNCGLMLFRAAIDRLLGTSESHLDDKSRSRSPISLTKHPEILDAILELLQSSEEKIVAHGSGREGVFPALQLLQKVQIPQLKRQEAIAAVLHLTSSRSWHVRDKAARTYAILADQDMIASELQRLMNMSQQSLNSQHGVLLSAKYLVTGLDQANGLTSTTKSCESATEPWSYLLYTIQDASHVHLGSSCPLIRDAYLDVLLAHIRLSMKYNWSEQGKHPPGDCLHKIDFANELDRSLTNPGLGPGEGQLRRTLGRLLAYQLPFSGDFKHGDILLLIPKLGECDADAAMSLFKELHSLCSTKACRSEAALSILMAASSNILKGDFHLELKCEVQRFLLQIAEDPILFTRSSTLSPMLLMACETATRPHSGISNHIYADQWLQLEAVRCDLYIEIMRNSSPSMIHAIVDLVLSCMHAIEQEHTTLFSREAAALSLHRLDALWHYLSTTQPRLLLSLCFGVYDLLNDDDEDIRQQAAKIVSRILDAQKDTRNGSIVCEPITASQRLVRFMLRRWTNDPRFATEAVRRAFGVSLSGHVSSLRDRITACSATDTALFVEEKQNLYVDEAREVKLWTQVVAALSPEAIPGRLVHRLAQWAVNGLDELREAIEAADDGPQGWTTKPDAFSLGLQVVYAAQALLRLVEIGLRLPIRPSSLRMKLGKLAHVADRWNINQLWEAEIDRVMTWAVTSRLAHQSRLLDGLLLRDKQAHDR